MHLQQVTGWHDPAATGANLTYCTVSTSKQVIARRDDMPNGVLLKMEVGIRKGAWRRVWRYTAYLWSLRWAYAVKKTRRLVYAVYPRIPPNTPLDMPPWQIYIRVQTDPWSTQLWLPVAYGTAGRPRHCAPSMHLVTAGLGKLGQMDKPTDRSWYRIMPPYIAVSVKDDGPTGQRGSDQSALLQAN